MNNIHKKSDVVKARKRMAKKRQRMQTKEEIQEFLQHFSLKRVFAIIICALFIFELGAQVSIFILAHAS